MAVDTRVNVVILAGGQGARFWPISRQRLPKQFLRLMPPQGGGKRGGEPESLIQATARRMLPVVAQDDMWVVTNTALAGLVREHVPFGSVLCEPVGKNTAASIGYAAMVIAERDPEAVMVILPADHAVKDEHALQETIREGARIAAQHEMLVTIGVPPTFPHTGYGYIRRGKHISEHTYEVQRFYEKPSLERATKYCESKDYFWNSGMFVWRARVILEAIREFMPALAEGLDRIRSARNTSHEEDVIAEVFENLESVSIDFGVLEHARNCAVVQAQPFGWNDVGSWDAWADHFERDEDGNLLHGDAVVIDSRNCVVYTNGAARVTALLGVEDLVVIDAGDALLICPRHRVQDVKRVVDHLKQQGRVEVL